MEKPTREQIQRMSITQINAYFRSIDDSDKWPVCGRFNATNRAIRRLMDLRHDGLVVHPGLEYYLALEKMISEVVNEQA